MGDFGFYFRLGWEHIMSIDALDHILFLMVLTAVYRLQEWKQVVILVTAFTIGHCITLALSTLNILEIPTATVEFLIPLTIVITALSNVFIKTGTNRVNWLKYAFALFFGLIHGLGFANTLRWILAEDQNFGWALFGFNVGLEAGQLVFVIVFLLLAELAMKGLGVQKRDWTIFISAAVFGLALQMALERL